MKILIISLISLFLFAKEVYFLPKDGYKAQKEICYLLTHAHKSIKIVMYSFTNKKIAKALKTASKHNIKIDIIADKEEANYKRSVIKNLATIKNINIFLLHGKAYKNGGYGKVHAKISIIDGKYLITGSANYTYSAFFKNYEYIIIHQNKNLIQKFEHFFNELKQKSSSYRLSSK